MKRRNQKGFTIVELVIVIAVIAVLAAVLIPTFSSLINKANESSDISAVRNMNSALIAQEAFDGKAPESASEAMRILKEAGLDAQEYSALASGTAIYYNKAVNRMIYVRLSAAGGIGEIIFPSEYDMDDLKSSFYLLSGRLMTDKTWLLSPDDGAKGTQEQLEALKTNKAATVDVTTDKAYYNGSKLVGAAIATYNGMLSVAEYIETQSDGAKNFTVVLGQDIDMKVEDVVQEWKPITYFAGEFYGRDHKIENVQIKDASADSLTYRASTAGSNYSFYGFISVFAGTYFGDVSLTVDIDEPGNGAYLSSGFNRNNHTTAGAIGGIVLPEVDGFDQNYTCTVANVTVDGTIIGVNRTAGVVGFIGGYNSNNCRMKANVTIENCVNLAEVTSANESYASHATVGGIVSVVNQWEHGSSITISDCENTGALKGLWVGGIVADAWQSNDAGTSTINGENALITVENCTNSGTLTGEAKSKENICVVGGIFGSFNGYRESNSYAKERYKLEISNCTNSGEIQYETVADSGCKAIYLAEIISVKKVRDASAQKNVIEKGLKNVDQNDELIAEGAVIALQLSGNTISNKISATDGGSGTAADPSIYVQIYANFEFAKIDYSKGIKW